MRPAIGFEDGAVEFVVDFTQDGDEAGLVDVLVLLGEGGAGAKFFKHVVHVSEREPGVELLLTLAVGVEAFGQVADGLFLLIGAVGEWEWVEAAGFVVARTIFQGAAGCKRPAHVDGA